MTIAILKLARDQKIPRPFNRACSVAEAYEMLDHWKKHNYGATSKLLAVCTIEANLDTEKTIFEHAGVKFYAFTEN
jgi:hypothetical protein